MTVAGGQGALVRVIGRVEAEVSGAGAGAGGGGVEGSSFVRICPRGEAVVGTPSPVIFAFATWSSVVRATSRRAMAFLASSRT